MIGVTLGLIALVVVLFVVDLAIEKRRIRWRRHRQILIDDLAARAVGLAPSLATKGMRAVVDVTTDPPRLVVERIGTSLDEHREP